MTSQDSAMTPFMRLHEHRMWSRRAVCVSCENLTDEQLRQTFEIGQGSVWATLLHLHGADFVWLEALHGVESPVLPGDSPDRLPGNQLGPNPIASLSELLTRWESLDDRWTEYLRSMEPSTLSRPIVKKSTSSGFGARHATPAADVLLHVCTHSQYTLAQAVNMLRHLGVADLPDVMLITMSRQQST